VGLAIIVALLIGSAPAIAQQIQTRLPAFQVPASDSLETQMLDRLSISGQVDPDDLPRLARLAVLESISTLVNIRDDLRDSPLGARLEREATALLDASQVYADTVTSAPLDLSTLSRARADFVDMGAAHQQLAATLGELPGLSDRAAAGLQVVSRLMNESSALSGAIESNLLASAPLPRDKSLDLDLMQVQARRLANDLVKFIGAVREFRGGLAEKDGVLADSNGMLARVQAFSRKLSLPLAFKDLEESFRVIRRPMWDVEARIARLKWPAELASLWRGVRARMNAISDDFGIPRVIRLDRDHRNDGVARIRIPPPAANHDGVINDRK
jgi:hypothetical protein